MSSTKPHSIAASVACITLRSPSEFLSFPCVTPTANDGSRLARESGERGAHVLRLSDRAGGHTPGTPADGRHRPPGTCSRIGAHCAPKTQPSHPPSRDQG